MKTRTLVLTIALATVVFAVASRWVGAASSTQARSAAPAVATLPAGFERATFAGGCFWCMEAPFDRLDGVVSTTSGYAGGDEPSPNYQSVSSGQTGHAEVVQIVFDPKRVRYEELLHVYWRNVDPVAKNRQFCDRGRQYRTAIYYHDDAQRAAALRSKAELESSGRFKKSIQTEIEAIGEFTPAESYHQNYAERNPLRYGYYRNACGRDDRLEELWGDEAGGGAAH